MAEPELRFSARWYELGDPDHFGLAFAYGAVALTTIWVLEHISELIIFSSTAGILLSDAAAHLAFRNSSSVDLMRWLFVHRPGGERRLCRRAMIAIFMRYLILAVDVAILFLSIPRSIDITEDQVGSTEFYFDPAFDATRFVQSTACSADRVPYRGFSASANREICVTSSIAPIKAPPAPGNVSRFIAIYDPLGLNIIPFSDDITQLFAHSIKQADVEATGSNFAYLQYRLPEGVHRDAVDIAAKLPGLPDTCQKLFPDPDFALLECTFPGPPPQNLSHAVVRKLFLSATTRKVDARVDRLQMFDEKNELKPLTHFAKVGSINRPRLCIIPALVVLAGLSIIALVLRARLGKQDFAMKLWMFVAYTARSRNVSNPIYTNCAEIVVSRENTAEEDFCIEVNPYA